MNTPVTQEYVEKQKVEIAELVFVIACAAFGPIGWIILFWFYFMWKPKQAKIVAKEAKMAAKEAAQAAKMANPVFAKRSNAAKAAWAKRKLTSSSAS